MLSIFSCVCEPSVCQTDFQGSAVLAHITLILLNNGPKAQDESCWQFRCSLTVPNLYIKLYHRYIKNIYIYEKNIVCVCVCVCVYICTCIQFGPVCGFRHGVLEHCPHIRGNYCDSYCFVKDSLSETGSFLK